MNISEAIDFLRESDPEFEPVLKKAGEIRLPSPQEEFEALVDSIVSQQLSTKAAATIMGRVRMTLQNEITPSVVLATGVDSLRSAGLSGQKTNYLYALAEAFQCDPGAYRDMHRMKDEEVVEVLTRIKGIGVWTAQMFLMFTLLREDVFPVGDLGIRRGMEAFLFNGEKQEPQVLIERAEVWSPYRSIASLALWQAQD